MIKKNAKSKSQHTPPFTLSARAVSAVAEIAALTERFKMRMEKRDGLHLRKINKIKSVRSSLAIEGNILTEEQVAEILEGRRVVAPLRDIQEVKNALATYDLYPKLDPFSVSDMLKAHHTMMLALVDNPGAFRRGGVGVTDGKKIIHMAPPASRVPELMGNFFDWLKNAEDHLFIRSCVFHYEFEFIHPFTDGNGRMGRLWQSLILGAYHPVFQHLPVETMVHDNQQSYYDALAKSTKNADSGVFIDFMLGEILRTLKKNVIAPNITPDNTPDGVINGALNGAINDIFEYIKSHPGFRVNHIAESLKIPLRTVQRHVETLKKNGLIEYRGSKKPAVIGAVKRKENNCKKKLKTTLWQA